MIRVKENLMPWYKFTSKHGPGHMGHSEVFQFFNHKLDKEELRYEWEHTFRDYDDNIGDAKIVRKLPAVITLTKKLQLIHKIQGAVKDLESLFGVHVDVKFPDGLVSTLQIERDYINTMDNAKHRRKMERLAAKLPKGVAAWTESR
jgi:hypothetical protein